MTRPHTGEGPGWSAGPRDSPCTCWRSALTTLRDEDITTTTNTLPAGDADGSDSNEQQVDPAGVDPTGSDSADADGSDGSDADGTDGSDADGTDS